MSQGFSSKCFLSEPEAKIIFETTSFDTAIPVVYFAWLVLLTSYRWGRCFRSGLRL